MESCTGVTTYPGTIGPRKGHRVQIPGSPRKKYRVIVNEKDNMARTPNVGCSVCGTRVYRKPSDLAKGHNIACSRECRSTLILSKRPIKECPTCGTTFTRKVRTSTYCSVACSNRGRAGIKYGVGAPRNIAKRVRRLKRAVINRDGEECSECSLGTIWNGKELVLQLDHINGIHTDDRMDNLRLLCPNCHTQTDTYGTKNRGAYT